MNATKYTYTVREASEADYPATVAALTDAFSQDPVMSKAMGGAGKADKISDLFTFQINSTYATRGTIDIAVTPEGKVLGAALWISPEGQVGSFTQDLKDLPRYLKILGKNAPAAVLTELRLLAARPKFKHWYLYTIGVHSDARSHGVGAALLEHRLAQLGEYPAYLEASTFRSAKLYAKHGFIELFPFKSGKPVLGMLHPAPVTQLSKHS